MYGFTNFFKNLVKSPCDKVQNMTSKNDFGVNKEGVRSGEGFKIIITNSQLVTPIPFIYYAHPTDKPPCPGTDV